jgi:hypothetical protein
MHLHWKHIQQQKNKTVNGALYATVDRLQQVALYFQNVI